VERRLGAIMFTDLVGYSAITSTDKGRALRLLEEHPSLLQKVFQKHGGVVVKTMGDGFLVEFASAVEAVNCAVEAQKELGKFNEGRADKALIRIGIHVGDVVHSGGDILGDAVNVAARLQPLAEVGGICISRQVVDQIERKVDLRLVKLGTHELKNIKYPVELYKVEVPSAVSISPMNSLDPRRIAILPLTNLSADPNDRYFADGMTEELISTVSRISELNVISRTSVMRYKDTTIPIGDIGRELSAGTVLGGSVRKAGNKVRITTQLIDAQNDRHLWAQSYDRDMTDIFAIQGDIAEKVAEALRVKLVSSEKVAVEKKATGDSEAYTLYLKGRYYWNERSFDGVRKAIRYFTSAIEKDPDFALGHSGLADCYLIQLDRGWKSAEDGIPIAKGHAEKAVELDGELAETHASYGLVLETMWEFARAEQEFKRAIELRPNYATTHHWYAILLGHPQKREEAYQEEKRALDLDPHSSVVMQGVGIALGALGRQSEAMAMYTKLAQGDPDFGSGHYWKAWAHMSTGQMDEAISEMRKSVALAGGDVYAAKMGLACVLLRSGKREEALGLIKEVESDPSIAYRSPGITAMVRIDQGDLEGAFLLLRKALSEQDGFLLYFKEMPQYAEFRKDPRWAEIGEAIGLPQI
jgi:TolB-like protein/class 3 adenylate cyclase